jgi:hypothetical protein
VFRQGWGVRQGRARPGCGRLAKRFRPGGKATLTPPPESDVPGLDRDRRNALSGIRQAGAFLIFALAALTTTVGCAHAFPAAQKSLTPFLREFVVSPVSYLAESELVNVSKRVPHLQFSAMLSPERINIIDPTPDVSVLLGLAGGKKRSFPGFYASEMHCEPGARRNDGGGRHLCGIAEGEYVINWPLRTQISFGFDDNSIGWGLTRVLKYQLDWPVSLVSIAGVWPRKQSGFDQQVGAQLSFRGTTGVAYLDSDNKNEEDRRDRKGIVDQLIEKSSRYPVLSDLVGVICGAIGITIYVNSREWFGAAIGFILIAVGILTPVFPWWAFVL